MVLGLLFGIFYLLTDFVFWAKWLLSYLALRLRKFTHRQRFDLYDFDLENQPEKLGILVPKAEIGLESPFPEEHLYEAADDVFIYGVNSKAEVLVVRVSRSCEDQSEAWIYLKLADGRRFELMETSGYQRNHGGKCTTFSCGGLQMHYLSPMRRWRIAYCGILKESRTDRNAEERTVFMKFTFIWTASSEVYDFPSDLEIKPTAVAMASARWDSFYPPIDKLAETFDSYSQSGVVSGVVSIEDEEDVEMYLFGERTRHLGKSLNLVGCKFQYVIGYAPESGLAVHLGKASVPNILHNLNFGFIIHPRGTLHAIEDSVTVANLSETSDCGADLAGMLKAVADKDYDFTGNYVGRGVCLRTNRNVSLEMREVELQVGKHKGRGLVIFGEVHNLPDKRVRKKLPVLPKVKPLTVNFTDDMACVSEIAGGKGSSLGKLTKLSRKLKSFVVPKGIIVTTTAYSHFLTPDTKEKIENLKNVVYGTIEGNIENSCKIVAAAIKNEYLPDAITKEIEEKLCILFDNKINYSKFAVRSSATGEDTDQMSAAGQMETFLGVQGLKEIYTAVKKCWASQFSHIAIEYKRQNGQILNSPMAVVIQEMVDCEAAGVLFTCDPVTSNPSVVVISGNYGLGESVVSGTEDPDTIVLQKLRDGGVEMKSMTIGLKQHKTVVGERKMEEDAEIIKENVSEEERQECCISKEIALYLGELSLKLNPVIKYKMEDYYKSPRDIEWGIGNGTIYIFQSRPVTASVTAIDYEIKHELDGPLRCEGEFFTTCNVGEVIPGAMSTLGSDFSNKYFGLIFNKKCMKERQKNNFSENKYYCSGLLPFYNHEIMNVVDLLIRMNDIDSTEATSMMMGIFGRILDDPSIKELAKYKELPPLKWKLYSKLKLLWDLFFSAFGLEKVHKKIFGCQFPIEKCKTSPDIFNAIVNNCSHHTQAFNYHIICTEMSSLWNMYMMRILEDAKGGIDNEVYSDFARLLSSSGTSSTSVESADVPSALEDLSEWISKDIKTEEFKAMSDQEALKWLQSSTTMAGYKFRQFMKRHGHRCFKEFDVYATSWSVDPKSLIKLLQNLSESNKKIKDKKEEKLSSILCDLKIPLNFMSRLKLRFILPNCQRCVREREACKSILVKAFDFAKTGFYFLSKSLVTEGYLPDSDLMYFMTLEEIRDLLHTRNPKFIARAHHRRKLFPEMDKYVFPDIMKGCPVPINEKEEDIEYVADLTMKGIPVSQGTVKGYARVAVYLEEAAYLQPGEILITHGTDIGWSPYFPILAGVVTELGGLISHGAVISREYGLPCIVGLQGATRHFRTGDYVLLDGNKGLIQRLTPPESETSEV